MFFQAIIGGTKAHTKRLLNLRLREILAFARGPSVIQDGYIYQLILRSLRQPESCLHQKVVLYRVSPMKQNLYEQLSGESIQLKYTARIYIL